jgi:hypothetical protein
MQGAAACSLPRHVRAPVSSLVLDRISRGWPRLIACISTRVEAHMETPRRSVKLACDCTVAPGVSCGYSML